jgi:hypothetical protein
MQKYLLLLIALLGLAAPELKAQDTSLNINTDPYAKVGPLADAVPEDNRLLPKIVEVYLPNGNFISRLGQSAALKNVPNADAISRVVLALYEITTTQGNGVTGKRVWTFSLMLIIFGITISGFTTFQRISKGEEPIGHGAMSWVFRSVIAMVVASLIAAKIPTALIVTTDYITDKLTTWITESEIDAAPTNDTLASNAAINAFADAKFAAAAHITEQIRNDVFLAFRHYIAHDPNDTAAQQKADELIATMAQQLNDKTKDYFSTETLNQVKNQLNALHDKNADAALISQALALAAQQSVNDYYDNLKKIVAEQVKTTSDGNPNPATLASITGSTTPDITAIAIPEGVVKNSAYVAFAMIGIAIWAMPLACLFWCIIFSLPKEWEMGGILFAGIKGILATIIAILLISVYITSSLTMYDAAAVKSIKNAQAEAQKSWLDHLAGYVDGEYGFKKIGNVIDAVGSATSSGNIGSAFLSLSGTSVEGLILAMLIITAPAQAALIVKGANGIAEHAKNAMHAGGMSSSLGQTFGGSQGSFAGQGGFQNASLGGGTRAFRPNFNPNPPQ